MDDDLKWIVGIGVTFLTVLITGIVAAFRNLANRISSGNTKVHSRIDSVKDNYVRRDDLDGHIERLDRNVEGLRTEIRDHNKQVLDAIASVKRD